MFRVILLQRNHQPKAVGHYRLMMAWLPLKKEKLVLGGVSFNHYCKKHTHESSWIISHKDYGKIKDRLKLEPMASVHIMTSCMLDL